MSIECPYCEKEMDPGDYSDHDQGDLIECEGSECKNLFRIAGLDYEPVYYLEKVDQEEARKSLENPPALVVETFDLSEEDMDALSIALWSLS